MKTIRIASVVCLAGVLAGCSVRARRQANGDYNYDGHFGTDRTNVVEAEGEAANLIAGRIASLAGEGSADFRVSGSGQHSWIYMAGSERRSTAVQAIGGSIVAGLGVNAFKAIGLAKEGTTQFLSSQETQRAVAETATKVPLAQIAAEAP